MNKNLGRSVTGPRVGGRGREEGEQGFEVGMRGGPDEVLEWVQGRDASPDKLTSVSILPILFLFRTLSFIHAGKLLHEERSPR